MSTLHFNIIDKDGQINDWKIKFSNLKIDEDGYISADNISVYKNRKRTTDLNETFAGHKYTPLEALQGTICAYINEDKTCNYIEVPTKIRNLKRKYHKPFRIHLYSRSIPEIYYNDGQLEHNSEPYMIHMLTNKYIMYNNMYDGTIICNAKTGAMLTNIDAFSISALVDMYKNDTIYYMTPETEDWVKEYINSDTILNYEKLHKMVNLLFDWYNDHCIDNIFSKNTDIIKMLIEETNCTDEDLSIFSFKPKLIKSIREQFKTQTT